MRKLQDIECKVKMNPSLLMEAITSHLEVILWHKRSIWKHIEPYNRTMELY
jgi:hypothetical protein